MRTILFNCNCNRGAIAIYERKPTKVGGEDPEKPKLLQIAWGIPFQGGSFPGDLRPCRLPGWCEFRSRHTGVLKRENPKNKDSETHFSLKSVFRCSCTKRIHELDSGEISGSMRNEMNFPYSFQCWCIQNCSHSIWKAEEKHGHKQTFCGIFAKFLPTRHEGGRGFVFTPLSL